MAALAPLSLGFRFIAALACALWLAPGSHAAPAVPADSIAYQGVLLDDQGDPRTGVVDLTIRIYDAASSGTLLYKQVYSATPLTDGTFTLSIGPTGAATDTPDDPLTTSLADVFSGDLVAGPDRFVELSVDVDPALARIQVVSAPLALRAESAATADTASVAITATSVNGLSSEVVTEVWEHFNFDGGPPNDDPAEGLGDTDLDGIANFVDTDNDNDGISDATETNEGSDINLVTPTVVSATPNPVDFGFATQIDVTGTNFETSGMTVDVGSQSGLVPFGVTSTSLQVVVGPQPAGAVPITVHRTNGESGTRTNGLTFSLFTPTVTAVSPSSGPTSGSSLVTVHGTNFQPGITVQFGSQNPIPSNVTPTAFDVLVGPQPVGSVDVTVTRLNGESGTGFNAFAFAVVSNIVHGVPGARLRTFDATDSLRTLLGNSADNYYVDVDGNGSPETFVSNLGAGNQADYAFDSTGEIWGFHCEGNFPCDVKFSNDPNGDYDVDEAFVVTAGAAGTVASAALGFAPGDEPVAFYARAQGGSTEVRVVHDRDGDDLYTGTNENVIVETIEGADGDIAVDGTGRVAVVYDATISAAQSLRLANDLNGDGDYADTVGGVLELRELVSGAVDCFGIAYTSANELAVVYTAAGSGTATLLHDLDGNGDFLGAGENLSLPGTGVTACDAAVNGAGGIAVVTNADGDTRLFKDADLDGLFNAIGEDVQLGFSSTNLAIDIDGFGQTFIANDTLIAPDL